MSEEAKTAEFTGVEAAIKAMRESGVPIVSDDLLGDRIAVGPEVEIRDVSRADKKLTVVFSTSKYCERDGCLLESKGVSLKNFKRNPVVLWMHDYRELPIATSKNVKFVDEGGGQLVGQPVFHGKTALSAEVWALIEMGVLKAWSLGFIPTHVKRLDPSEVGLKSPSEEDKDKYKSGEGVLDLRSFDTFWRIVKSELLEYSAVTVPADANALSKAIRSLHDGGRSVPELERQLRASGMDIPELVPAPIKIESREDAEDVARSGVSIDAGEDKMEEIKADEKARGEEKHVVYSLLFQRPDLGAEDYTKSVEIAVEECEKTVRAEFAVDESGAIAAIRYVFDTADGWDTGMEIAWIETHEKAFRNWAARMLDAGLDIEDFTFIEGEGLLPIPRSDDAFRVGKVLSKTNANLVRAAIGGIDTSMEKSAAVREMLDRLLKSTEKPEPEKTAAPEEKKVEPKKKRRRSRLSGAALRSAVNANVDAAVDEIVGG
jgi:phage head maturation protease